jgi:hypothetical protein
MSRAGRLISKYAALLLVIRLACAAVAPQATARAVARTHEIALVRM